MDPDTLSAPAAPIPAAPPAPPPEPADDGARLRARFAETRDALLAEGMHHDHAHAGAWWRCLFDAVESGAALDHYEADALLSAAGVSGPAHKMMHGYRWSRLRRGDMCSPGSTMPPRAADTDKPDKPAPGMSPAEFKMRGRQVQRDRALAAWTLHHAHAPVRVDDVRPEVLAELAGAKAGEWTLRDVAEVLTSFAGMTEDTGRVFQILERDADGIGSAFAYTYRALPRRDPPRDPDFAAWADRFEERLGALYRDPRFDPANANDPDFRYQQAAHRARGEVVAAFMVAHDVPRQEAERRLTGAGVF